MKLSADKRFLLPAAGLAVFMTAAGAAYFAEESSDKTAGQPLKIPASTAGQEKELPAKPPVRIRSSLLLRPLRDPFRLPPQLEAPPASGQKTASAPVPILRGTVAAGHNLLAIIEYGGGSSICGPGGSIGGCTVRSISNGSVLLSSPAGDIRLALAEGGGT